MEQLQNTTQKDTASHPSLKEIVEHAIEDRPLIRPSISTKRNIQKTTNQIEHLYYHTTSLQQAIKTSYATNSLKQHNTQSKIKELKNRYNTVITDFEQTTIAVENSIKNLDSYKNNLDNALSSLSAKQHTFAPSIQLETCPQIDETPSLILYYQQSNIQTELKSYDESLQKIKKLHKPLSLYVESMQKNQQEIKSYLDSYRPLLEKTGQCIDMLTFDFS